MQQCIRQGYQILAIAQRDAHTDKLLKVFDQSQFLYREITCKNSGIDPFGDWQMYKQLYRIYKEESPSVIFHYVTKPVIYGSWAANKAGIPAIGVITGLGHVFAKPSWLSSLVRFLFRFSLKNVHQLWFLNKENADFFVRKNIVPQSKIQILPGEGINTETFIPKPAARPEVFTFIMVSRTLWSKGLGVFMDASAILKERGFLVRCQCLGKPEPNHPNEIPFSQIRAWQEQGLLEWLGESDDVADHLSKADCLVAPTYYEEGVPRSIMEACSMELPVIGTHHIGCTELIEHGINGLLCAVKDPVDLAQKMEDMMRCTPDARKEMGRKGREKMISRFSKENVYRFYENVIRELIP